MNVKEVVHHIISCVPSLIEHDALRPGAMLQTRS